MLKKHIGPSFQGRGACSWCHLGSINRLIPAWQILAWRLPIALSRCNGRARAGLFTRRRCFRSACSRVSFREDGGDAFTWAAALCAPCALAALSLTCLDHRKWRDYTASRRGCQIHGTALIVISLVWLLLSLPTMINRKTVVSFNWNSAESRPTAGNFWALPILMDTD